jgi:putative endonuclease
MTKGGHVYIITNAHRTTLYIGVTSALIRRIDQHKQHFNKKSFTDRYNLEFLVYYEAFGSIEDAIAREKELKKWNRQMKDELITASNPEWKDLWDEIVG